MSGAPGAVHQADYYSVSIYGGLSVDVDPPPDEDPNEYLATYYDEEDKPYELWLGGAFPNSRQSFSERVRSAGCR